MEIPICIDNEGNKQEEHCWHPGSMAAVAPQSQRCCHCGLELHIQSAPYSNKKHGKHARHRILDSYDLVIDTEYRDMYAANPESFDRMDEALEEGRKAAEAARKVWGGKFPGYF